MTRIIKLTTILTLIIFDLIAQTTLIKVNEIKIESIYSIDISDYDPISKNFLGLVTESKGFEIVLINSNGEIIKKKKMAGQGPGQINGALNGLGFSSIGGIWIFSTGVILFYDMDFNYLRQQKFESKYQINRYGNPKKIPYFYLNDLEKNETIFTYPSGERIFSMSENIQSEFMLELLDTKKNENYFVGPVTNSTIGKKIDNSMRILFFPIYTLDRKRKVAYVLGSIDNEIIIYDLISKININKIRIQHNNFFIPNKEDISVFDFPSSNLYSLTSINKNLLCLDSFLVLNYVNKIEESTFKFNLIKDQNYHHFKDPKYNRLIIFNKNRQISEDISMPKNSHLMIGLPDNELLFKIIDPEKEEDFVRYQIYKIVND